jgi:hypothetical protein
MRILIRSLLLGGFLMGLLVGCETKKEVDPSTLPRNPDAEKFDAPKDKKKLVEPSP